MIDITEAITTYDGRSLYEWFIIGINFFKK